MKHTQSQIVSTIELMKKWGMFDNLTDNEQQTILQELKNIAGTAIMDANNKTQNILPDLYKEITA